MREKLVHDAVVLMQYRWRDYVKQKKIKKELEKKAKAKKDAKKGKTRRTSTMHSTMTVVQTRASRNPPSNSQNLNNADINLT